MKKRFTLILYVLITLILHSISAFSKSFDNKNFKGKESKDSSNFVGNHTITSQSPTSIFEGNECVSFLISSSKKKYEVSEVADITIVLRLYDLIKTNAIGEDCQKFSINVAFPKSFKQTGGDYQNYMNVNLSKNNPEATIKILGEFTKKDSSACFILMKGPLNSNTSTIFIKKKEYCIESVDKPLSNDPTGGNVTKIPTIPKTGGVVATNSASPCTVSQMVDRDIICAGQSITLTAPNCSGGASWRRYQYDLNNNWVSTANLTSTTNTLTEILTSTGFYDYDAPLCNSGQSSCPSGGSLRVTVKAGSFQQVVTPSITPNVICTSNTTLTANGCSGTTHWYRVAGLSENNNIQLFVGPVGTNTWVTSGNDYIIAKCEIGCSLSDESNKVYGNDSNIPTIISSSYSYCTGGPPVTLTATGCKPWQTVVWSNGMEGTQISITPQTSTYYFARCNHYDTNGLLLCDNPNNSNGISISINTTSLQTPTITPTIKNVCSGESSGTTISASGCSNYLWSNGETTPSIIVQPTQSTIYTVRCGTTTSCLGPQATSTINVYASASPTSPTITSSIPRSGNEVVNCSNQPFTLTGGNCNGTLDWYWRPHNNSSAYTYIQSGQSITINNSTHVVYSVACRTECRSGLVYGDFIVLYPPVGNVTASSNSPLVIGQTLSLNSNASNSQYSSTLSYAWTGPNSFVNTTQNPSISSVTSTASGDYNVSITNGRCTATSKTNVVINDCTGGANIVTTNPSANPSIAYTDKNNIVENIYLKGTSYIPTSNFDVAQTISYIDGFGRPAQVVNTGSSPTGKDIILPIEYDAFGRNTKSYLPYATTTANGSYKATAVTEQASFYTTLKSDNKAYAETILENSPIQILKQQGFVGTSWQPNTTTPTSAKTIKADFKHTTETSIRKFSYNYSLNTWVIGTYGANELMVSETKDIDNNIIEEFTDFAGNMICKRVWNPAKTSSIITYNAYDGFNRLAFSFPPLASDKLTIAIIPNGNINPNTNTNLKDLIFYYAYDKRGRLISKKVPSAALEEMVYDPLDKLVLYRNGLNSTATTPIWQYTKYDELGRVHSSGIVASSNTLVTMQANCDSYYLGPMQYGTNAFPTTSTGTLTETIRNFYDSYSNFVQPFSNGTVSSSPQANNLSVSNSVNGKLLGVKENILLPTGATALTKTQLTTAYYYDNLGRMVQNVSEDQNGKLVSSTQKLDFVGRMEELTQDVGFALLTSYTTRIWLCQKYDQGSRLKVIYQRLNNDPIETVGKYSYNEIGELTSKLQGCDLQTVNYKFDIQGKLTDINEVNTTNLNTQKKFFGEKITYNLNGSIQKVEWGTIPKPNATAAELPPTRSYTYTYDYLYRMTAATYAGKAGEDFSATTAYDKNGNITTLTRKRGTVTEDNLTYTYTANTNTLVKVADANTTANTAGWFKDGTNTGNDYTYDVAGNIKTDLNKGITNIDYNYLNLPERISFSNGTFVRYIYTASGEKIRKEHHDGTKTDYIGGIVYKNAVIEFIPTPEGRAIPDGATFRYEYQITDHLGNLRSTFYKNKTAPVGTDPLTLLQENHYDPWGLNLTDIEKAYTNADRFQFNAQTEKLTLPNGSYDYDTDFRQYDPQLGRFKAIDLLADFYPTISPFSFGYNNPTSFNDPLGLFPFGDPPVKGGTFGSNATGGSYTYGNRGGYGQGPIADGSAYGKKLGAGFLANTTINQIAKTEQTRIANNYNSTIKSSGSNSGGKTPTSGGSSKVMNNSKTKTAPSDAINGYWQDIWDMFTGNVGVKIYGTGEAPQEDFGLNKNNLKKITTLDAQNSEIMKLIEALKTGVGSEAGIAKDYKEKAELVKNGSEVISQFILQLQESDFNSEEYSRTGFEPKLRYKKTELSSEGGMTRNYVIIRNNKGTVTVIEIDQYKYFFPNSHKQYADKIKKLLKYAD